MLVGMNYRLHLGHFPLSFNCIAFSEVSKTFSPKISSPKNSSIDTLIIRFLFYMVVDNQFSIQLWQNDEKHLSCPHAIGYHSKLKHIGHVKNSAPVEIK